jgi:hypothetical protein
MMKKTSRVSIFSTLRHPRIKILHWMIFCGFIGLSAAIIEWRAGTIADYWTGGPVGSLCTILVIILGQILNQREILVD